MSEDMQQDSIDCAAQAMEKFNIEKDIAACECATRSSSSQQRAACGEPRRLERGRLLRRHQCGHERLGATVARTVATAHLRAGRARLQIHHAVALDEPCLFSALFGLAPSPPRLQRRRASAAAPGGLRAARSLRAAAAHALRVRARRSLTLSSRDSPLQTSRRSSTKSTDPRGESLGASATLPARDAPPHVRAILSAPPARGRHCVVGRNFGSYVTHETKNFVYFVSSRARYLEASPHTRDCGLTPNRAAVSFLPFSSSHCSTWASAYMRTRLRVRLAPPR